ncbi:MAG: hypothetical protein ACYCT9_10390 [Leptospirillum sp.]|jgi:hypothetical protein
MEWLVLASRTQERIGSAMKLLVGVLFSLTGLFFGQSFAASIGDERFLLTGKASKLLGGIVTQIQKGGLADHAPFLMNLVPITKKGRPLCRKPSGHLVRVFKDRMVQSFREHSAFIVMGPQPSSSSPHIKVGDCLTVTARKLIPLSAIKTTNEDQIRIFPLGNPQKESFFQAFGIKLWKKDPPESSSGVFSRR